MVVQAAVTSFEMAKDKIKAGAREIYLGYTHNPQYKYLSLNGRWREMNGVQCQIASVNELKSVIKYAHDNNTKVLLTANNHYLRTSVDEWYEYLSIGCEAGVDYFIISNIDLIEKAKKMFSTPIVVGTFAFITNEKFIQLLQDLGAVRIVLPHSISLTEIKEISEKFPDLEIEVFAHIGGGNNCGRCMMLHSPMHKEINAGCRAGFKVTTPDNEVVNPYRWFDAASDCSLCNVPDLMNVGVKAIKIVGRESPSPKFNAKITEVYVKAIEYVKSGKSIADLKKDLVKYDLSWTMKWVPMFCETKRCKFQKTEITKSYI